MKLDQIVYFVKLAETLHLGKAAKTLHISPSAVSHSMKNLERILGSKLFQKSGNRLMLTDFGKNFAARAEEFLQQGNSLLKEFRSGNYPLTGTLRLAASHGLSQHFLAPLAARLQRANPALSLELFSLRSSQVVQEVAEGRADLGLCFSPQENYHLKIHKKWNIDLKIAVRNKHPILSLPKENLVTALKNYPTTTPKPFLGIDVCEDHPALTKIGLAPKTVFYFDSYDVAMQFIANSDAWGLIPENLLLPHSLKAVEPLGFHALASVALVSPRGRSIPDFFSAELARVLN